MKKEMCYCGKKEATKRLSNEDGSISLCDDQSCRIKLEDELRRSFQDSHQGRTKENYEASVKINMAAIIVIGLILTGYGLYRILQMCGIC